MADDKVVVYAIGFLEGWIRKAAVIAKADTGDEALNYLAIVESAFNQQRLTLSTMRRQIEKLREHVNAISAL